VRKFCASLRERTTSYFSQKKTTFIEKTERKQKPRTAEFYESNFTHRPRAVRLVHVVDVVIDVIVVVEMVIAGGIGGVVVARVMMMMIRMIPIVVLVMLVQHHCGQHVERLSRTVSTRNERKIGLLRKKMPTSLLLVSPHDSKCPLRLTELKYRAWIRFVATVGNKCEKIMRLVDGETFRLFITLEQSENIFAKPI